MSSKLLDNKIVWLIISSVVVGLIGFFSNQMAYYLSIPDRVETTERAVVQIGEDVDMIKGGVGSIEGKLDETTRELYILIRVLKEKEVIK